jgi:hypothetical protein
MAASENGRGEIVGAFGLRSVGNQIQLGFYGLFGKPILTQPSFQAIVTSDVPP